MKYPAFESSILEGLSRIHRSTNYGSFGLEIGKFLPEVGITDIDSTSTKWNKL